MCNYCVANAGGLIIAAIVFFKATNTMYLLQDLASDGVGLGSVHGRQHPRIVQYCGVSQVPSVVGVISGRVHHYYGQLRDKGTLISFLDNILPKNIVTLVSRINPNKLVYNRLCVCIVTVPVLYDTVLVLVRAGGLTNTATLALHYSASVAETWLNGPPA